ncbi:hypothetical protein JL107_17440 [Nakamurella flavida]|uniref:Tetratricopeptide repeat protein n=1 Tax=Nakamurella flavida TaxID=363630 RepID=A0A938YIC9_9ACTN|nr:hypothetical protein [Nakamurella flavida]MBM9478235.1 hypothetical protein [Nakamurella flavida]MDP9777595.1 tetratricopeptide (TPR) repeat protein [Nakamurella flavida]
MPDDLDVSELDPEVRRDLRGLSAEGSQFVGAHLLAAVELAEDEPELAWRHARAARSKGGRIAVVRETVGLVAYRAGQWSEAVAELRAARRMSGGPGHLAVMADCERAQGNPEKAIELSRSAEAEQLDADAQLELRIVVAAARADLGQLDAALVHLEAAGARPDSGVEAPARLLFAYADLLEQAGRRDEAIAGFLRAVNADTDEETDAEERLAMLVEDDTDDTDPDDTDDTDPDDTDDTDPDDTDPDDTHDAVALSDSDDVTGTTVDVVETGEAGSDEDDDAADDPELEVSADTDDGGITDPEASDAVVDDPDESAVVPAGEGQDDADPAEVVQATADQPREASASSAESDTEQTRLDTAASADTTESVDPDETAAQKAGDEAEAEPAPEGTATDPAAPGAVTSSLFSHSGYTAPSVPAGTTDTGLPDPTASDRGNAPAGREDIDRPSTGDRA